MVNLHVLLIGISHYQENDVCSSLEGAVADVEAMEVYLLEQGVPSARISKLTVSNSAEGPPPEPRDTWPTYENMVAAIRRLTAAAEPGEQVLIHYSGHGGRTTPSLIPGVKGAESIDEGLIPPNIGEDGARFLRDVELTYLLHEMVEKGLQVTMVLDACHSAGLFRGGARLVARGSRGVDEAATTTTVSLVASPEELEATWRRAHNLDYMRTRGAAASGWLAAAEGCVLLAACRPVETAYEYPFAGRFRGLLTHSLLGILAEDGHDLSFRQIHNRLISRVQRHAPYQTPVIEGDVTRLIFGGHLRGLLDAIPVLEVDPAGKRVRLGVGEALGVAAGALLQLHPAGTPADRGAPGLGIVEIIEAGASESWAALEDADLPREGDQAVLIDPGVGLRRRVAVVPPEGVATADAATLDAVRSELRSQASRFLERVETAGAAAGDPDFQVSIRPSDRRADAEPRQYEIWHADGQEVVDLPSLPATAPERVVECLEQLAMFYNVRDLDNRDGRSPLRGKLEVEIGLLPEDFTPGDKLEPQPFPSQDSLPSVETGWWICLTVVNHSYQALDITVLDLQPGWTIEQIFPTNGAETLDGGKAVRIPFQIYLPRRFRNRRETFKVFGTADPVSFRWLELPALDPAAAGEDDTPRRRTPPTRSALHHPLNRLFAGITWGVPTMRGSGTGNASRFWTSTQVEFEVVKSCR